MENLRLLARRTRALPLWLYCIAAGLVAFLGSAFVLGASWGIATALGLEFSLDSDSEQITWADAFGMVVFAPLVETLLLIGLLKLLNRAGLNDRAACIVSALLWGLLHGLLHPMRFFGSIWSFAIFGAGYLAWRGKSPRSGFMAAAGPHVVVNSIVLGLPHVGAA